MYYPLIPPPVVRHCEEPCQTRKMDELIDVFCIFFSGRYVPAERANPLKMFLALLDPDQG